MKYFKFIIIAVLFFGKGLFSQELNYDELKKIITQTHDNADSLYFLNKQLLTEIIKLNKEKSELVTCYLNLSEYAVRIGYLPEAASYASEATLICESEKMYKKLTRCYYQKARILNQLGKTGDALFYYRKGKALAEKNKNKKELSVFFGQLGFVFANLNKLDSALCYQNKALSIHFELKDSSGIAVSYSNIGYAYSLNHQYETAKKYYYKAYTYRKNAKDIYVKAASLIDCADIEQKLNNHAVSIKLVNEALGIIRSQKIYNLEMDCYQTIASAYAGMKRWDSAYKYHDLFKITSDSVYNQQKNKASEKVEVRYQLNSKQNEIALLTEKNKNSELLMLREKMIKWIFVCGLALLVIILFMVFRQLKIKKEAFNKINEQKETIEEKNKEIIDSIHYAKRIQTALMVSEKQINNAIKRLRKDNS